MYKIELCETLNIKGCSELKIVDKINEGFPFLILEKVLSENILTRDEILSIVVPKRTLARRKQEGKLSPKESDIVTRLIRVLDFAQSVFENPEKTKAWFHRPNKSLEGKKPVELLKTETGSSIVEDVLGRIAHGIYS